MSDTIKTSSLYPALTPSLVLERQARWASDRSEWNGELLLRGVENHQKVLATCDTYFVRKNMCNVIECSAKELGKDFVISSGMFPPSGFLLFERPFISNSFYEALREDRREDIVSKSTDLDKTLLNTYYGFGGFHWSNEMDTSAGPGLPSTGFAVSVVWYAYLEMYADLFPGMEEFFIGGQRPLETIEEQAEDYGLRIIFTTLLLMGQRLARVTRQRTERATRRRLARADSSLADNDIRVIDLRLPEYQHTGEHAESPVEWSHRWMVSGHWRQQWYAKDEVHRPKWIMPYVKGPEDKPLEIKPTVHVLRR